MQKAISKYWPIFVLPTLVAFIIGFIWPFIWGVYLSFQRFTTVSKTTFVGIQNYLSVFQDSTFLHAFGFTAVFTVVSTVLINVCAFAIALVLMLTLTLLPQLLFLIHASISCKRALSLYQHDFHTGAGGP